MSEKTRPDSSDQPIDSASLDRHSRARRRLLQSIAAGGAAISVKPLPDQWAKPLLDVTMLPAHAEASVAATLACEVGDVLHTEPGDVSGTVSGAPRNPAFDPPVTGGQTGTLDNWRSSTTVAFTIQPTANLIPASAGPVTLMVGGQGGALDIDSGNNQVAAVDGDGDANFADVVVEIVNPTSNTGTFSQIVDFNFSAAGQQCVINVEFNENNVPPPT